MSDNPMPGLDRVTDAMVEAGATELHRLDCGCDLGAGFTYEYRARAVLTAALASSSDDDLTPS